MIWDLFAFILAATISILLTYVIRLISVRLSIVDVPAKYRWNSRATPTLGGVAISLSFAASSIVMTPIMSDPRFVYMVIGLSVIFLCGLLDDISSLKPYVKLIIQIVASMTVLMGGIVLSISGIYIVDATITIIWIVGITNAFNLIDNMDGICGGTAIVSAIVMAIHLVFLQDVGMVLVLAAFSGACLGFMFHNSRPASIFMGDCGSLSCGFIVSVAAIYVSAGYSNDPMTASVVPILVLSIPIMDTAFVSFTRPIRGQSIARGGKDHLSHRLVSLGMNERQVAFSMYGLGLAFGMISLMYQSNYIARSVPIVFVVLVLYSLLCTILFFTTPDLDKNEK